MPIVGYGAGSVTVNKDLVVKSDVLPFWPRPQACGPAASPGCCQGWLSVFCLPQNLPDAAARLKGKKNWFQFPTRECPNGFDLDQGYFIFLPILSQSLPPALCWCTSLGWFWVFCFSSLFLLCGLSSCLALCPDPLKPSRASQPTRIMMSTKAEMRHWLLAGWQTPGRTCSWEGTGAAWPIFPDLRIDLTLVNEEQMILVLR